MSATRTPDLPPSSPVRKPTAVIRRRHTGPHGSSRYWVPAESRFAPFLAVAIAIFTAGVCLGMLIPPEEKLPPMIEVDLGIDGIENEPPPLGEPDAGAGEVIEQPAEPEQPEMVEEMPKPPEPEPEPESEPEPEPEPEPTPAPEPEFTVPEEPKPEPKPAPKPVSKPKPKPAPKREARPATAPAGSGIQGARAGVRGSPGGKPGGRGGGRGDFIRTPSPQYDATARQRRYEGRGTFVITYQNGTIISVRAARSTGVPYLDSRTITWIKTRWRVKSGTSGEASLPITWQLR